jgi:hypothetical protein
LSALRSSDALPKRTVRSDASGTPFEDCGITETGTSQEGDIDRLVNQVSPSRSTQSKAATCGAGQPIKWERTAELLAESPPPRWTNLSSGSDHLRALRTAAPRAQEKSRSRGEMSATAKSRDDGDSIQNFVTRLANDRR